MVMASSIPFLQSAAISLIIFSTLIFLVIFSPPLPSSKSIPPISHPPRRNHSHRAALLEESSLHSTPNSTFPSSCSSILQIPTSDRCSFSLSHCNADAGGGIFNYASLHFCHLRQNPLLSVPFLSLIVLFLFFFLVTTARDFFSASVTCLAARLSLSPSVGAVTLLALGNGAPDVFSSVAAVRGGHPRTGFGAILSAGTFVSAFVVGFVAIYAAPFSVDRTSFLRDVFFYLISASALFYVYLSAEIFLWQAIGLVGFYMFFVGFVFWMDVIVGGSCGGGIRTKEEDVEMVLIPEFQMSSSMAAHRDGSGSPEKQADGIGNSIGKVSREITKISRMWEVPVSTLLKLTIPSISPSDWNRFYVSANFTLCPLALLYSCRSFIALDRRIVFLLPHVHFPIWLVVFFAGLFFGLLHYYFEKEPPEGEQLTAILFAFVMSVFWISTAAAELLDCLEALGTILELPSSLLGVTVLAWGNSVGDLVADVAVAKAGQPAMAMAGCFAGPMFNMLVGLGTALMVQTADVYPRAYVLQFNLGIMVAFVFLFLSLMGSLLVVTLYRFRVPRFWGFCLVGLYIIFIAASLIITKFSV